MTSGSWACARPPRRWTRAAAAVAASTPRREICGVRILSIRSVALSSVTVAPPSALRRRHREQEEFGSSGANRRTPPLPRVAGPGRRSRELDASKLREVGHARGQHHGEDDQEDGEGAGRGGGPVEL